MLARALLKPQTTDRIPERLPLYIAMSGLNIDGSSGVEWIVSAIVGANSAKDSADSLELTRLLISGKCCVMFDGIDEIEPAGRARFHAIMASFAASYPANRMVIVSRMLDSQLQYQLASWHMMPMTEEDAHALLEDRFPDYSDQLLVEIRERLGSVPLTPLVLNLLGSAFNEESHPTLPAAMGGLVDRLLRKLGTDPRGLRPDIARLLLRRMFDPETAARRILTEVDILAVGRDSGLTDVQTLAYIDALLDTGIIIRQGLDYSLAHDVLAAYFAGGK